MAPELESEDCEGDDCGADGDRVFEALVGVGEAAVEGGTNGRCCLVLEVDLEGICGRSAWRWGGVSAGCIGRWKFMRLYRKQRWKDAVASGRRSAMAVGPRWRCRQVCGAPGCAIGGGSILMSFNDLSSGGVDGSVSVVDLDLSGGEFGGNSIV